MKRVLNISAKCSDLCWASLKEDGKEVATHDGYVPDFMPGTHYGDYIELSIDIDTGQILNWEKPTKAQLQKDLNNEG
jgi:hypothetical protein